ELLHRYIRRSAQHEEIGPRWTRRFGRGVEPRRVLRMEGRPTRARGLERIAAGAALLLAGGLWAGLPSEPTWVGWLGAAICPVVLVRAGRQIGDVLLLKYPAIRNSRHPGGVDMSTSTAFACRRPGVAASPNASQSARQGERMVRS